MLTLALFSCEGGTKRDWYFKNNSTKTIQITIQTNSLNYLSDSIFNIPPSAEIKIIATDMLGASKSVEGCATIFTDVKFNHVVTKDILDDNNWTTTSKRESRIPSEYYHQCFFTINDSDIL